jgi:hypothetical protein
VHPPVPAGWFIVQAISYPPTCFQAPCICGPYYPLFSGECEAGALGAPRPLRSGLNRTDQSGISNFVCNVADRRQPEVDC